METLKTNLAGPAASAKILAFPTEERHRLSTVRQLIKTARRARIAMLRLSYLARNSENNHEEAARFSEEYSAALQDYALICVLVADARRALYDARPAGRVSYRHVPRFSARDKKICVVEMPK